MDVLGTYFDVSGKVCLVVSTLYYPWRHACDKMYKALRLLSWENLGMKLYLICVAYMSYINHSKEVYMVNILPETEVRGSLQ